MFLKVCGITRSADAIHAIEHGATALGFVFWAPSPRHVSTEQAAKIIQQLPDDVMPVGLFVDESIERIEEITAGTGIRAVQLHGDETPAYAASLSVPLLRAMTVDEGEAHGEDWPADTVLLLDAVDPVRRGGTGIAIDWDRAAALARRRRVVLAGGLTPFNVAQAIAAVRPYGVDVSSGVEATPGVKDSEKVARFLAEARRAFEQS
jgi:phosphoribosylanthranilate isomerase